MKVRPRCPPDSPLGPPRSASPALRRLKRSYRRGPKTQAFDVMPKVPRTNPDISCNRSCRGPGATSSRLVSIDRLPTRSALPVRPVLQLGIRLASVQPTWPGLSARLGNGHRPDEDGGLSGGPLLDDARRRETRYGREPANTRP